MECPCQQTVNRCTFPELTCRVRRALQVEIQRSRVACCNSVKTTPRCSMAERNNCRAPFESPDCPCINESRCTSYGVMTSRFGRARNHQRSRKNAPLHMCGCMIPPDVIASSEQEAASRSRLFQPVHRLTSYQSLIEERQNLERAALELGHGCINRIDEGNVDRQGTVVNRVQQDNAATAGMAASVSACCAPVQCSEPPVQPAALQRYAQPPVHSSRAPGWEFPSDQQAAA